MLWQKLALTQLHEQELQLACSCAAKDTGYCVSQHSTSELEQQVTFHRCYEKNVAAKACFTVALEVTSGCGRCLTRGAAASY